MHDQICSVFSHLFSWIKTTYIHLTASLNKTLARLFGRFDNLPWLLQLSPGQSACGTGRSTADGSEQCGTACSEERKRDHRTSLLYELHWLLVKFRCEYKIATFAYRHFDNTLPYYPSASLSTAYQTSRVPRSWSRKLLELRNVIWNLAVSVRSVSRLHLSAIRCLPVCVSIVCALRNVLFYKMISAI